MHHKRRLLTQPRLRGILDRVGRGDLDPRGSHHLGQEPDELGRPTNQDALELIARDDKGRPLLHTGHWPNTGVGRLNLDGSKGSCTSCHTRHRFSVAEARMPEACDQCHLGPDHPNIEIYENSKHGHVYKTEGHTWNFDGKPGEWQPGEDYRAPTSSREYRDDHAGRRSLPFRTRNMDDGQLLLRFP